MNHARVRQRVRHLLADGEMLITSLACLEEDGRRRRFAALTDRRLLLGWLRPAPTEEFDPADVTGSYDPTLRVLTLYAEDLAVTFRAVDEYAARALLDLLVHRQPVCDHAETRGPRIRLVDPVS